MKHQYFLSPINDGNVQFYEGIELCRFKEFARIVGLDECADLEAIYGDLQGAASVVELGSGYGRALGWLEAKGYTGKVYGVERIAHLAAFLTRQHGHYANIICDDIRSLLLPSKVDRILWLWSGILELSPIELFQTLTLLFKQLTSNGVIYLETPCEIKFLGDRKEGDHLIHFETSWGKLSAYMPNEEELKALIEAAGYQHTEVIFYATKHGVTRKFFKLYKHFPPIATAAHVVAEVEHLLP